MKSLALKLFLITLISVYFCSGSELPGSGDENSNEKRKVGADGMSKEEEVEYSAAYKRTRAADDKVDSEENQSFADFYDPMIRNQFTTNAHSFSSSPRSPGPPPPSEFAPSTPASTSQSFSAVESPGSVYSVVSLKSATNSMIEEYDERMQSPIRRNVTVESDVSEGSDDDRRVGLIDHPNRNYEDEEEDEEIEIEKDQKKGEDSFNWNYYFPNSGTKK